MNTIKLQGKIVYKCNSCNCVGAGNRMVDHIKACDGTLTRKLREAERDGTYKGREEEAQINTELLFKQEAVKELWVTYQEMKQAIEDDIITIKQINSNILEEAYTNYYSRMF